MASSRWILIFLVLQVVENSFAYRHYFISSPSIIRLGVEETLAITSTGLTSPQHLQLSILDNPGKRRLWSKTIIVNNDQPVIESFKITKEELPILEHVSSHSQKHYVVLTAKAPGFQKETMILVNANSGYVIVQTDKPIYTPKQKAHIQIIGLSEELKPSQDKYRLQIKNPQDIAVLEEHFDFKQKPDRFFTHRFSFPIYSLLGEWKAIVFYGHKFQLNSSSTFELKEYVLPTFSIDLFLPDFILPQSMSVDGVINAKYVYGESVRGTAFFKFGVKNEVGDTVFVGSLLNKILLDGVTFFSFDLNRIKNHKKTGWFPEIAGSRLVVECIVQEQSTGKREMLTDESVMFTKFPYKISFKDTLKDFKPGLPVLIKANLNFIHGDIAPNVPMKVRVRDQFWREVRIARNLVSTDNEGRLIFGFNSTLEQTSLTIELATEDYNYTKGQQALAQHIIGKFTSETNSYITLTPQKAIVHKVGEFFHGTIYKAIFDPTIKLHFFLIVRGKIVLIDHLPNSQARSQTLEFFINQEMVPKARVVVFTHHAGELIADSIVLNIEPSCSPYTEVAIEPEFAKKEPGSEGKIIIKGFNNTLVSLLAVDKSVYLLKNNKQLTRHQLFDIIGSHDQGCGPGGGYSSEMVLEDAGVVILTDVSRSHNPKSEFGCVQRKRVKRSIKKAAEKKEYTGVDRKCCDLGFKPDPHHRTCEMRADIINKFQKNNTNINNCSQIFLECCLEHQSILIPRFRAYQAGVQALKVVYKNTASVDSVQTRYNEFIEEFAETEFEQSTLVRNDFRETWIFDQFVIGSEAVYQYNTSLPHSITTWMLQATSLSLFAPGICVTPVEAIKTFKDIFLFLNMPYSVIVNEQIELKATIFNYKNEPINVIVYIYGLKDLCTGVQEGEKSERKKIIVPAKSSESVSFPMVPLKEGEFQVKVVALSPVGSDVIVKPLQVVPKGTPVEEDIVIHLDPSNQQRRKRRNVDSEHYRDMIDSSKHLQQTIIELNPPQDYIPGTESCVVMAIGDQYGPTIQTVIDGAEHLISKPIGCGEQTMIRMAPTLYALHYLNVKNLLTPDIENKAFEFLRDGYKRALTYRKPEGGFSVWTTHPPSLWLTSFIIKIFCQATDYIHVDKKIITTAIRWLNSLQNEDGSFTEIYAVHHKEMLGGIEGRVPSTAFILIAILECQIDQEDSHVIRDKGTKFLAENLPNISEPYILSMVTYALALANHPLTNITNQRLQRMARYEPDSNMRYWFHRVLPVSVEATSYALLTQLKLGELDYSHAIINWLNNQRSSSGSFISTQDTVMGLQAITEYAIISNKPNMDLICNITYSQDGNLSKILSFQPENAFVLQQFELDKIGGILFLNTTGKGIGHVAVKMRYNLPRAPEKICKFDLNVLVRDASQDFKPTPVPINQDFGFEVFETFKELEGALGYDNERSHSSRKLTSYALAEPLDEYYPETSYSAAYAPSISKVVLNLKACVKYLGGQDSGMTILDVGIFSGFVPKVEDLEKLAEANDSLVGRYEVSSRGVMFYLDWVPHEEPLCLEFAIIRDYIVGSVQPSVVRVYDYYVPDEACTIFYSPDKNSPIIHTICEEDVCRCAEGGCPPKEPFFNITLNLSNWHRPTSFDTRKMRERILTKACLENDYVWKGVVNSKEVKNGYIFVKFIITKVIKEGAEKKQDLEDQDRLFVGNLDCQTSSDLEEGKIYILMGRDGEKYEDKYLGKPNYRYVLDQTTSIYLWETVPRTNTKNLQKTMSWLEQRKCQ